MQVLDTGFLSCILPYHLLVLLYMKLVLSNQYIQAHETKKCIYKLGNSVITIKIDKSYANTLLFSLFIVSSFHRTSYIQDYKYSLSVDTNPNLFKHKIHGYKTKQCNYRRWSSVITCSSWLLVPGDNPNGVYNINLY